MRGQRIASLRTKLNPSAASALTISGVPAQQSAATIAPIAPAPSIATRLKFLDSSLSVISARARSPLARSRRLSSFGARAAIHRAGLSGRTWRRSVRAEDAAIAGIRFEQRMAVAALVKERARCDRHFQPLGVSALRAGEDGSEFHGVESTARERRPLSQLSPLTHRDDSQSRCRGSPVSRRSDG